MFALPDLKKFAMYFTSASVVSTFINHRLTYSDNGGQSLRVFLKTIPYMLERATQQILDNTGAPIIVISLCAVGIYYFLKSIGPIPSPSPSGKGV